LNLFQVISRGFDTGVELKQLTRKEVLIFMVSVYC